MDEDHSAADFSCNRAHFHSIFKKRAFYIGTGGFIASMALIVLLVSLVTFIPKFVSLRSSYVSGKSVVVEGIIQNFRPAPALGPATESFSVNGIVFSYDALEDTPCFHDAPIHRGPIQEGLKVRIPYNDSCIQRIDIF